MQKLFTLLSIIYLYNGKILSYILPYLWTFGLPYSMSNMKIYVFVLIFNVSVKYSNALSRQSNIIFTSFFTRPLGIDTRLKNLSMPTRLVSAPCEGIIQEFGKISFLRYSSVKNIHYNILNLIYEKYESILTYNFKYFFSIYLSPQNYHRVLSPLTLQIDRTKYIRGSLYPIAPLATVVWKKILYVNERIVILGTCNNKGRLKISLIIVGALNVGHLVFNYNKVVNISSPLFCKHREEIGTFNLGSSIIILVNKKIKIFNVYKSKYIFAGEDVGEIL